MKKSIAFIIFLLLSFDVYFSQAVSTANFTSNVTSGCIPLTVNFINNSTNATDFIWDFGNGAQSTLQDPSAVYTQPGFYTVQLIAQNSVSSDTIIISNYIEVLPSPIADFQVTQSGSNCEDDNIYTFQNLSSNAISYIWDFGDGNTSTTTDPIYTYTSSGIHVINLIATNSNGCSSGKTIPAITIDPNPIITATSDVQTWCDTNHLFIFNAATSNSSNVNWEWDFGDGSSTNTNLTTTNHQYNSTGIFNVYVSGTTPLGCVDTILVETIQIYEEPISSISVDQQSGCQPFDAEFSIQSSSILNNIVWNFGDGTVISGPDSISHIYINNGNYNISAFISDNNGCQFNVNLNQSVLVSPAPTAQFSSMNTAGCLPLTVLFTSSTNINNSLQWDFGDLTSFSSQSSPSHTYLTSGVFFPELTVTDNLGCSTTYLVDTINAGITDADFISSVQSGCAPLTVNFTSVSLIATNYFWDFGDGQTSSQANPMHVYDSIGIYDVTFICWNNSGCVDTVTYTSLIETSGGTINLHPTDTITACSPYDFQPNAQNIGQNTWLWDFGDGTTGQGSNPTHTYQYSGNYTVKLTSYTPNGCLYELENFAEITIDDMYIDLSISIAGDCDTGQVTINNNSIGVVYNVWNFGDASSSTSMSITHDYDPTNAYLIIYTAVSQLGCSYTQYIPIVFNCDTSINPPPVTIPMNSDTTSSNNPGVVIPPLINCGPQFVNLYSPYPNAQSFYWNFGDGFSSGDQNPSHYYNLSGNFDLRHYAYHSNGDIDTLIITNFISQQAFIADFTYTENILCNSTVVTFNDISSGAVNWNWDFGGGATASTQIATHTFPLDNTIQNITLEVTDSSGCIATKTIHLYLFEPIILIEYDTLLCYGDTLNIEAYSNHLYYYQWDMDDGNINNNQFTYHIYQNGGFYNVILEASDAQGCSRIIPLDSIEVLDPVSTFTPNSNLSICVGDTVNFISDNQNADYYHWHFGNVSWGGYINQHYSIYNTSGVFDISHKVYERGCIGTTTYNQLVTVNEAISDFSYQQVNGCLPITVNFQDLSTNAVSWLWDLGDGSTSTAQNPSHVYNLMPTDSITLEIMDINGCSGSYSMSILQTLTADFGVSDTLICTNASLQFNSTSSVANSWLWDFGDGGSSILENPTYSYQSPGVYDVTLVVSDGQGCDDTIVKLYLIEVQEVVAQFSYTSPTNCPPIISQFTNLSTGATNYQWNFGDSSVSILTSPAHIYTAAGIYDITLIALNDIGCSDTTTSLSPIVVPGPILDFTINTVNGCDSLDIQIQNLSSNALNYYWDFGDGSNSTAINPSHTYTNPGSYLVTLVAEDTMGCQSFLTYYQLIEILNSPIADFILSATDICTPAPFSTSNNSLYASSYKWSFAQQTCICQNASFFIYGPGQQDVELIATNNFGCADTTYKSITGHYLPAVTIYDPGPVCKNEGVMQLQSNNYPGLNVTWSGNGIVNSNNGQFDPSIVGNSTTIYASSSGYCSSSDSLIVSVVDPPDATILTNNIEICEGGQVSTLQAANQGGIWLGPQTHPLTGNISSQSLNSGNYIITYILSNGVCSDTDNINLVILPQPDATIIPPGLICSNDLSVTLTSISNGGIWSGINIGSSTGEINISNMGPGFYNYSYSIQGDCPATDSIQIEIVEFIEANIIDPAPICEGDEILIITATNGGGIWSGNGVLDVNNGVYDFSSFSEGSYIIVYETNGLCSDIDSSILIINPIPIIDFQIDQSDPCLGIEISVQNNSPNINNENYFWFINDSLYSTSTLPSFNLGLGNYTIALIVENQFGCKANITYDETVYVYDTTALPSPEIIRSTVINNQDVYTEWDPKQTATNAIKEYVLFKSADNVSYEFLGTLDSDIRYYTDVEVDVFNEDYTYYVVSINKCNIPSKASNISSSVLLGYDKPNEFQTQLRWNSYEKWKEGVNRYEVQKLNEFGNWEVIKIVNHNINKTIIDE